MSTRIPYALYENWPLIAVLADGTVLYKPTMRQGFSVPSSKKRLGKVYQEVDGYYVWLTPATISGSDVWGADILRLMADTLDELNRDWDKQVKEDLAKTDVPTEPQRLGEDSD